MALFPRRVVQRCLNELGAFVSRAVLHDWVQRLNQVKDDYLATEWEVVLLWIFARFGNIQHEPPLGRRPIDLVFDADDGNLHFAADIAAISDEPLHERNPIDPFRDALNKRIEKARIHTGRFIFQVQEEQPIPHRGTGRKRRLLLPPVKEFAAYVFNAAFDEYIKSIRREPSRVHYYPVQHQKPDIDITIEYQPGVGRGAASAVYGSYTSTTVIDNNPLFNALKSKADQLRRSGYDGIRGIIVCDRGSRIFNEMSNWATYRMEDVVHEFLRQNSSVAFVTTMGVRWRNSYLYVVPRVFVRRGYSGKAWVATLNDLITRVVQCLPQLQQTPENVLSEMRWNRSTIQTKPYFGESIMSANEIRISARELLDLLSGRLDQKRFLERHAVGQTNFFNLVQSRRGMISAVGFEHRPDEDDDLVILQFSEGDPAVSPFKVPELSKSTDEF